MIFLQRLWNFSPKKPDHQILNIATPDFALRQGATHLVVGRSILKSNDPLFVVENIMADIKKDKLNG